MEPHWEDHSRPQGGRLVWQVSSRQAATSAMAPGVPPFASRPARRVPRTNDACPARHGRCGLDGSPRSCAKRSQRSVCLSALHDYGVAVEYKHHPHTSNTSPAVRPEPMRPGYRRRAVLSPRPRAPRRACLGDPPALSGWAIRSRRFRRLTANGRYRRCRRSLRRTVRGRVPNRS